MRIAVHERSGTTGARLEEKRFPKTTIEALKSRGHDVREQALVSGLQAIGRANLNTASGGEAGWFGGADSRREGVVRGD